MRKRLAALSLLCFLVIGAFAQQAAEPTKATADAVPKPRAAALRSGPKICTACIRAHMEFLASDALRGRGSATPDELVAATYVGVVLEQYGIAPAGDDGTYLQRAVILQPKLRAAPVVRYRTDGGSPTSWTYGQDFEAEYFSNPTFQGPLQRIDAETQSDLKKLTFH